VGEWTSDRVFDERSERFEAEWITSINSVGIVGVPVPFSRVSRSFSGEKIVGVPVFPGCPYWFDCGCPGWFSEMVAWKGGLSVGGWISDRIPEEKSLRFMADWIAAIASNRNCGCPGSVRLLHWELWVSRFPAIT
jgi:hypothetical protein